MQEIEFLLNNVVEFLVDNTIDITASYAAMDMMYEFANDVETDATTDNFPYTGKGFTASKNVVLPEWEQTYQNFREDDVLEIIDSKTGDILEKYVYSEENGWVLE